MLLVVQVVHLLHHCVVQKCFSGLKSLHSDRESSEDKPVLERIVNLLAMVVCSIAVMMSCSLLIPSASLVVLADQSMTMPLSSVVKEVLLLFS